MAFASERVQGVRVFLNNGNPEQAIRTSRTLLADGAMDEAERFELLSLIVDAEEMRAQGQHYEDISHVINAIETLEKEFPKRIDPANLLWRMAWLHWKHGDAKIALQEARRLYQDYNQRVEATQAAMLMARIYIEKRQWSDARSNLMKYGLQAKQGSREEALTRAWMAVINAAEHREQAALAQLQKVQKNYPQIIENNRQLWSVYIQVLHMNHQDDRALKQCDLFLDKYISGDEVASIRLLRADLWQAQGNISDIRIEREYDALASEQAEQSIGKQAFMRKLMLSHKNSQDYRNLKPVIIALKRIANENQLSPVENEAMLDLARLWKRLSQSDVKHAPKQSVVVALDQFSRVARSEIHVYNTIALQEGRAFFESYLKGLIKAKKWTETVAIWERFPLFRRDDLKTSELQFGVAHALRMLMSYDQSEALLDKLYAQFKDSVWGQKVMLERAHLWLDRGDNKAIARVLAWLDEHEFTLYRPEMLLLVARMQLQAGDAAAASQSMVNISVNDIEIDERAMYWKTRAAIAEKLEHWHIAARAWREYGLQPHADINQSRLEQANNLFKAKNYQQAEALYQQVDASLRDAAWQYHYSICQLKTGKYTQAMESLEAQSQKTDIGIYASLAGLAIAERQADVLMKENP